LELQKQEFDGFNQLLNLPDIQLWLKWGSPLNSTLPVMKAKYVFHEDINPVEFLSKLQISRREWDKNILLLDEIKNLSSEARIVHYALKAPLFFMKNKDFVEKRILFFNNGVYYGYSSSTPNDVLPVTDQYQRCETIFSGSILTKENNSLVYFIFSQVDMKVKGIINQL
jgi:hypothetical protein